MRTAAWFGPDRGELQIEVGSIIYGFCQKQIRIAISKKIIQLHKMDPANWQFLQEMMNWIKRVFKMSMTQ